jgi:hypothetical protein
MMQSAAFILNIADSVAMVAVRAGCAVIMGSGHGGLAFEQVRGVVGHRRHDAGNLGDQKQPEKPRAQAALREQQSQGIPLDLHVPLKLGTLFRTAKPASGVLFGYVAAKPQDVQAVAGGKVDQKCLGAIRPRVRLDSRRERAVDVAACVPPNGLHQRCIMRGEITHAGNSLFAYPDEYRFAPPSGS